MGGCDIFVDDTAAAFGFVAGRWRGCSLSVEELRLLSSGCREIYCVYDVLSLMDPSCVT